MKYQFTIILVGSHGFFCLIVNAPYERDEIQIYQGRKFRVKCQIANLHPRHLWSCCKHEGSDAIQGQICCASMPLPIFLLAAPAGRVMGLRDKRHRQRATPRSDCAVTDYGPGPRSADRPFCEVYAVPSFG